MERTDVRRLLALTLAGALGAALGAFASVTALTPPPPEPVAPTTLVTQMREVARLESLDVSLHKKITFTPDPVAGDSIWEDVFNWARRVLATPRGKVIVFADAHLGIDLTQLDATRLRIAGSTLYVVLPPLRATVELLPGETEVIGSNLDTAQTAQLLAGAKDAFLRQVEADPTLAHRARAATQRALSALAVHLGFREVHFVEVLPNEPPT